MTARRKITHSAMYESLSSGSGFHNTGYWLKEDDDLQQAQLNLITRLVKGLSKTGRVLDVACGFGASGRFLENYYEHHDIYGIDISEERIAACKKALPDGNFRVMSATDLKFGTEFFDDLMCIGSAIYFDSREIFFREAHRVLKRGGRLAMHDVIAEPPRSREDGINDLKSYRAKLRHAKFKNVKIYDVSKNVFEPNLKFMDHYVLSAGRNSDTQELARFLRERIAFMKRWKAYVLVFANK